MRATTTDRIIHSINGFLGKNSWDYSVTGRISFVFDTAAWEPDMGQLREAIVAVDKLYPWVKKKSLHR